MKKFSSVLSEFNGRTVLGLGCAEGFQLFLAEAFGATRMVGVRDEFLCNPGLGSNRALCKELLGSRVEFLDVAIDEISHDTVGSFDVVIVCDALVYARNPSEFVQRLCTITTETLICATPVISKQSPLPFLNTLPILFRLPTQDHETERITRYATTEAWVTDEFSSHDFSVEGKVLWENKTLTFAARKRAARETALLPRIDDLPLTVGGDARTVVLVMSCAKYSQCWDPFFTLFQKYWPDCPYPVYLVTDHGSHPFPLTLQLGQDRQWATNILTALEHIEADRMILFQEDFLLSGPAHTAQIRRLVQHSYDNTIASLRLFSYPFPRTQWSACADLGVIGPFDDFRGSFQLSIWDTKHYASLMQPGENPWETEFGIAHRSALAKFPYVAIKQSTEPPLPYLAYAVDSGAWREEAWQFMEREGISTERLTKRIADRRAV